MKKLNAMENNLKKPWLAGLLCFSYYILWIVVSIFAQENIPATIKGDFVQAFKLSSKSMAPSILKGDRIMVEKWFSKREGIHREDIIIFPFPKDETRAFIKRVVGLPGETLEIKKQKVFINGQALDEPYAFHSEPVKSEPIAPRDDLAQIIIPEGMLFVMGDNRENSLDSRYFGFIEVSKVMGKVKMLYWSYDKKESQVRWNRIGKLVS
jgi:signal peptidase I